MKQTIKTTLLQDNKNIHGLWIGTWLSSVELLCIKSFLQNGHSFLLWTYDTLENEIPQGCLVKDAGIIIPREQVFSYKNKNQFGHGKGSYAGFSDVFRYKLLYEYGGWWVDMDVTCLKPLDFPYPYVFRTHHDLSVVGNVMKCPPKSELMLRCYKRAVNEVDEDNRDWNKPIRILNETIVELGLQQYICEISNRDSWTFVKKMIVADRQIPENWYVIHWVNVEWTRNRVNKNYSGKRSVLRGLYEKYNISVPELSLRERLKNRLRIQFSPADLNSFWSYYWGYAAYYINRFKKSR